MLSFVPGAITAHGGTAWQLGRAMRHSRRRTDPFAARPATAAGGLPGTLGDMLGFELHIVCRGCLRSVILGAAAAAVRHGHDLALDAFRRRARCKGCGEQVADLHVAERRRTD